MHCELSQSGSFPIIQTLHECNTNALSGYVNDKLVYLPCDSFRKLLSFTLNETINLRAVFEDLHLQLDLMGLGLRATEGEEGSGL